LDPKWCKNSYSDLPAPDLVVLINDIPNREQGESLFKEECKFIQSFGLSFQKNIKWFQVDTTQTAKENNTEIQKSIVATFSLFNMKRIGTLWEDKVHRY